MTDEQWRQITSLWQSPLGKTNYESGLFPSREMVDEMIGEIERLRAEVERLTLRQAQDSATPRPGFLTWLNQVADLLPVGTVIGVSIEELGRWYEAGMTVGGAAERINQEIR